MPITDDEYLDGMCEGIQQVLDVMERKRGKPIRTSTMRKVFKELLRTQPELIKPLLNKVAKIMQQCSR